MIGDGTFQRCHSLTEISLPASVVSIHEDAFYECVNLKKITYAKRIEKILKKRFSAEQWDAMKKIVIDDERTN